MNKIREVNEVGVFFSQSDLYYLHYQGAIGLSGFFDTKLKRGESSREAALRAVTTKTTWEPSPEDFLPAGEVVLGRPNRVATYEDSLRRNQVMGIYQLVLPLIHMRMEAREGDLVMLKAPHIPQAWEMGGLAESAYVFFQEHLPKDNDEVEELTDEPEHNES